MSANSSDQRSNSIAAPNLARTDIVHALVRSLQQLNYDVSDPNRLLKAVQNVDFGLSAESEFAAIAAWLGRCSLIHHLGQEPIASPSLREQFELPDLLCILSNGGVEQPILVEVKTTKASAGTNNLSLRATRSYLDGLRKYADTIGVPLLFAWRCRALPFWMLFDPATTPYDDSAQRFRFADVIKNDLMGPVFGDCHIVAKKNAGLRIEMDVLKKTPNPDRYWAHLQVSDAFWQDAEGERLDNVPNGVKMALLAACEELTSENNNQLILSFLSNGGMTRTQSVLRMLAGMTLPEESRVHWREVAQRIDHFPSNESLLKDVATSFGKCIQYVFHQHPQRWPTALPEAWNQV